MWRRVLAETALAVAGSGGVCFLLYALLGLSIGGGGVGGVVMIVAPLATPLLVAPLAAYPFARANERIAALLAEVEATRRALADEVAEGIAVQRRLEELARRDPLTGLLNRRGFFERATAAAGKALAVTVVDVDNFKEVNDRFGHAAGDAVLNVIASSLRQLAGRADVARLGGDEFAVLAELDPSVLAAAGPGAPGAPDGRLSGLVVGLPDGTTRTVSCSTGRAVVPPGGSIDAALAAADVEMYEAKRARQEASAGAAPPAAGRVS